MQLHIPEEGPTDAHFCMASDAPFPQRRHFLGKLCHLLSGQARPISAGEAAAWPFGIGQGTFREFSVVFPLAALQGGQIEQDGANVERPGCNLLCDCTLIARPGIYQH